jgi:hypothetical protein
LCLLYGLLLVMTSLSIDGLLENQLYYSIKNRRDRQMI